MRFPPPQTVTKIVCMIQVKTKKSNTRKSREVDRQNENAVNVAAEGVKKMRGKTVISTLGSGPHRGKRHHIEKDLHVVKENSLVGKGHAGHVL